MILLNVVFPSDFKNSKYLIKYFMCVGLLN